MGDIKALASSLPIDGGQQYLSGPERNRLLNPRNDIEPGLLAAVVGINLPAIRADLLGLYRKHHALAAESPGDVADQPWIRHGGGIDRDLVRAGAQEIGGVIHRADTPAHRHGYEYVLRGALHDIAETVAAVQARHAVHVNQFVGALLVVPQRMHVGRAYDAQALEMDTLD